MKRTRSQITSDLYILNWKSSYDVTLFMCQSRSTIFPGILVFVIFRPRDIQEYIFMFSIALEWIVNSICDHQIPHWCCEIHWQTLSHLAWAWFKLITTSVVIGTDCICSCKSNYHEITTTMAPFTGHNLLSILTL